MSGLHLTHRRAERFADAVDGSAATDQVDGIDTELLALVGALRSVPDVQPRADFAADLRGRLMVLAETELVPTTDTEPTRPATAPERRVRRPRERRFAVAIAAVAIVGASSSMAVASQSALPGDTLYPIKRAIEDAHAHLSIGDQAEGTTLLHNAGDRLDEARDLSAGGDGDAGRVTESLNSFTSQLSQGADLLMHDYRERGDGTSIDVLRRFDTASMTTLTRLEGTVPEQSEPALLAAAERLFTIDAAAGQLCPACSTAGITEIPPVLLSSDTGAAVPTTAPTVLPSATPDAGGGRHGPHASPSTAPSHRPTSRPTATNNASPTSGPTSGPTSAPTNRPTTRATPSDVVSSILGTATSRPTHQPSGLPTVTLPTGVPSVLPSLSSVASAIATSVSGLLGGLG